MDSNSKNKTKIKKRQKNTKKNKKTETKTRVVKVEYYVRLLIISNGWTIESVQQTISACFFSCQFGNCSCEASDVLSHT